MRLVFLGPPGAGKGTQAALVSKEFEIPHISTGKMLREARDKGTQAGQKAKEYMMRGELVPDSLVTSIVAERISDQDAKRGFILDGFPRTAKQAEMLDEKLAALTQPLDMVVYFAISESACIDRLSGRWVCVKCGSNYHVQEIKPKVKGICDSCGNNLEQRTDDTIETIKNRLSVYREQTAPLLDLYKSKGLLQEVSAEVPVEAACNDIKGLLAKGKLV